MLNVSASHKFPLIGMPKKKEGVWVWHIPLGGSVVLYDLLGGAGELDQSVLLHEVQVPG